MTCDDCTRARAGIWGGYVARCDGCTARAIARSLAAFNALDPKGDGDKAGLRDAISRCMPTVSFEAARKAVWDWWRVDHAQEVATA